MCPPKCDKKDLHVIGASFRGVLRSKIKGDLCCLKVSIDVQKPLQRGIFVGTEENEKTWVPFKYENHSGFCSKCERMGHVSKDCAFYPSSNNEEFPYSTALRAESSMLGREMFQFNSVKKSTRVKVIT